MYRDIWCIHAWDKLKHTKESFCLLPIIPFLLLTFSHKIPLWRSQVWKKNSHTLSPPQNIFGLSPYPLDVQFCFIVSFKMFVLTPQPPHPLWIFNGPFWLFFLYRKAYSCRGVLFWKLEDSFEKWQGFPVSFYFKKLPFSYMYKPWIKKTSCQSLGCWNMHPKSLLWHGDTTCVTGSFDFFFFNSFHTAKWVLHSRLSIHK